MKIPNWFWRQVDYTSVRRKWSEAFGKAEGSGQGSVRSLQCVDSKIYQALGKSSLIFSPLPPLSPLSSTPPSSPSILPTFSLTSSLSPFLSSSLCQPRDAAYCRADLALTPLFYLQGILGFSFHFVQDGVTSERTSAELWGLLSKGLVNLLRLEFPLQRTGPPLRD